MPLNSSVNSTGGVTRLVFRPVVAKAFTLSNPVAWYHVAMAASKSLAWLPWASKVSSPAVS